MNTNFRTTSKQEANSNKITDTMWKFTTDATEVLLAFTKAFIIIGGVLAAALADIIFGAISATILFGNNVNSFSNTPVWVIGGLISLATSAIQIIMWGVIEKRGIGLKQIMHFSKIPRDIQAFLFAAGLIWIFDDIMDISPIFLLIKNSQYQADPWLYNMMVTAVVVLVFIICSFSELLTGNLKSVLSMAGVGSSSTQQTRHQDPYRPVSNKNSSKQNNQNSSQNLSYSEPSQSVNFNDIRKLMNAKASSVKQEKLQD